MKLAQLDYYLPKSFIAQTPAKPRDHSRLLVIDRKTKKFSHHFFYELPNLLTENDVLVFNKTKVFPARLFGKRAILRQGSGQAGGGKAEVLLLRQKEGSLWEAITKPGFFVGDKIFFEDFMGTVTKRKNYITEIEFNLPEKDFLKKVNKIGHTPLPPYIKLVNAEEKLRKDYQTVYAKEVGSAAAPTAGLHFTKRLLGNLKRKGIQMEFLTLHVGLGTFAPIKKENISEHKVHSEYFGLDKNTAKRLNNARRSGNRIVTVGTTTARVLETLAAKNLDQLGQLEIRNLKGATNLFIYPPYKFKFVDALITNFHLPKSSLLALVSAFVSYPNTEEKFQNFKSSLLGKAYQEAINQGYRFFSFGDACLIL